MTVTITKNKLNFEEYLHYDDGTDNAYELVDGELILMNPPTGRHGLIIRFLSQIIEAESKRLNLDWIALQKIGIRTGVKRSRLPDLCVISRAQINQVLDISAVIDSPPLSSSSAMLR
jgi:Uma2 family endonuclease